ncbi:hypothetical protein PG993_006992 [Apiospora rasikravindrae]|uniref:Uncharacterized protein n=1 Tax=Apiospora rasikravindrae TaxID=990691 RepID=A0ABR1SW82_9PEZI
MEEDSLAGKRQIKLMQNEVLTLVGRLNDAYQERDELRHCVRAIEGFPDKPALLLSLQRENLVLRKQLLAAQPAREHASCSEVGRLGPIDVDPGAELELIKDSVADACASLEGDGRILDPSKDQNASLVLSQWASKVFGQDLDFKSFVASCKKFGIKMVDVRRSLVATSLWALVWQHPFEEIATAESPMHDSFKKQLLARYGLDVRQLDTLAYRSWVSEPSFKDFVASRSKTLSDYMCHALAPLLGSESKQSDVSEVSDWIPAALFEDAVHRTIELAAKIYLTDRDCFWAFPQHGSQFDSYAMTSTDVTTSEGGSRTGQAPTVQLCLFPALYMSKLSRSSASPDGRAKGTTTSALEDLSGYRLVAKGLVLVKQ